MDSHNCGDGLIPAMVVVRRLVGNTPYRFQVPGERCTVCNEEYISRDWALEIERQVDALEAQWKIFPVPALFNEFPQFEVRPTETTTTYETYVTHSTTVIEELLPA